MKRMIKSLVLLSAVTGCSAVYGMLAFGDFRITVDTWDVASDERFKDLPESVKDLWHGASLAERTQLFELARGFTQFDSLPISREGLQSSLIGSVSDCANSGNLLLRCYAMQRHLELILTDDGYGLRSALRSASYAPEAQDINEAVARLGLLQALLGKGYKRAYRAAVLVAETMCERIKNEPALGASLKAVLEEVLKNEESLQAWAAKEFAASSDESGDLSNSKRFDGPDIVMRAQQVLAALNA